MNAKPSLQVFCVVLACVLFLVAAYLSGSISDRLTAFGLAVLTLALVL